MAGSKGTPDTTSTPSVTPVGVTGDGGNYRINNDYLYPQWVYPIALRTGYRGRIKPPSPTSNSQAPYQNNGLVRGWIYPIDVNEAEFTAQTTVGGAEAAANDAATRAAAEPGATDNTGKPIKNPVGPSNSSLTVTDSAGNTKPKKIRWREGKQFQFNPFAISFDIGFQIAAPPETTADNGTAGKSQVGGASTSIEMFFDRTLETAAATAGQKTVNGATIDPVFKDIGVQKDLWDVYRIILGGDEDYWATVGQKLTNIDSATGGMTVRAGSITDMSNRLFDLGQNASTAFGRRIALFYNPNIVIIGDVTSIGFIYAEFNGNYVPIKAKLDLQIAILSTTSESGANDIVNATDTTTDTSTSATDDPLTAAIETPSSGGGGGGGGGKRTNSNLAPVVARRFVKPAPV